MIKLANDKLGRDKFLQTLFRLFDNFGNQNGHGLTIVINGKYGAGKTTLLDFIEEKNAVDNKFNVVKYNTWENNFFDNPLIPILYTISNLQSTGGKLKETAKTIIKNIPKAILSTVAGVHGVDVQPLFSNENVFIEFDEYKSAIEKFKKVLTEYCANKKTILLVDELDRCLPEYQIKVLESLHHLLDIPNLIILITLDKEQLETAIKAKFGESTNIHGYLAKFIQYEIDLPPDNTYAYVMSLMNFKCQGYEHEAIRLIAEIFQSIQLPIRECQIVIAQLNLLLNENKAGAPQQQYLYWYPILVTMLLLLKKCYNDIYIKYIDINRDSWNFFEKSQVDLNQTKYNNFLNDINNKEIEKILEL